MHWCTAPPGSVIQMGHSQASAIMMGGTKDKKFGVVNYTDKTGRNRAAEYTHTYNVLTCSVSPASSLHT